MTSKQITRHLQQVSEKLTGWMYPVELRWLADHAYGEAVEIGSYCGKSASAMVQVDRLTCIDSWKWPSEAAGARNFASFVQNRLKFPHQTHAIQGRSTDVAIGFPDLSLDFCFIDAAHDYDSVLADIVAWLPKVKQKGLIAGHDFNSAFPGVMRAVRETFGQQMKATKQSIWAIEVHHA